MIKLGQQLVYQNATRLFYGRKLPQNDPNNAKSEHFQVFFYILGSFCTFFVNDFLAQNGFQNPTLTTFGIQ